MQWSVHSSFFLSFLASYCSPAPAWLLHRPQSFLGVALLQHGSSRGCNASEHPSFIRSASFHEAIFSHVPKNIPFHIPPAFSPNLPLYLAPHGSFLECPPVSPLISPSCVSCTQQLPLFLKHTWAEALCAPLRVWKFGARWAVSILFRVIWNLLWLAQGSLCPPSTQAPHSPCYQTLPFMPNTDPYKLKWCIFFMLHLLFPQSHRDMHECTFCLQLIQ